MTPIKATAPPAHHQGGPSPQRAAHAEYEGGKSVAQITGQGGNARCFTHTPPSRFPLQDVSCCLVLAFQAPGRDSFKEERSCLTTPPIRRDRGEQRARSFIQTINGMNGRRLSLNALCLMVLAKLANKIRPTPA